MRSVSELKYPYPKDVRRILGMVFGGIGVVMLVVAGIGVTARVSSLSDQIRTAGTVVDLREARDDNTYAPVVEFITAAQERITITSSVFSSPSAYDIGERVEVAYDPADPRDGSIVGFGLWLWQLIVGGIGLIFVALGTAFFVFVQRRRRVIDRLIEQGTAVIGTVLDVISDYSQQVNSRHPYRVIVGLTNPQTGAPMQVRSDPIWQDPRYSLPSTLTVWVDPKDPDENLVDLSFLPR